MSTFLVTWNPDKFLWDNKDRSAAIRNTAAGRRSEGSWSTGGRKGGIVPERRAGLSLPTTGTRPAVPSNRPPTPGHRQRRLPNDLHMMVRGPERAGHRQQGREDHPCVRSRRTQ